MVSQYRSISLPLTLSSPLYLPPPPFPAALEAERFLEAHASVGDKENGAEEKVPSAKKKVKEPALVAA
jgi:hypothetical protein